MSNGNEDMKAALVDAARLAAQGNGRDALRIVNWGRGYLVMSTMIGSNHWTARMVVEYREKLDRAAEILPARPRFASGDIGAAADIIPT